nr:MAG TPA: hypothetical protein [Caudoviricetes sp.]
MLTYWPRLNWLNSTDQIFLTAGYVIHKVQSGAEFYMLGRQYGEDTIY